MVKVTSLKRDFYQPSPDFFTLFFGNIPRCNPWDLSNEEEAGEKGNPCSTRFGKRGPDFFRDQVPLGRENHVAGSEKGVLSAGVQAPVPPAPLG